MKKRCLLILDNFEHLLAPSTSLSAGEVERGTNGVHLVSDILQIAPSVKIIATSRERLKLQEEQLFQISGINFPDWKTTKEPVMRLSGLPKDVQEYGAVKLFLRSARRVQPGFELTVNNLTGVARICRLVQGMPLGILLAAAWVEMLSPTEIATEIGQSLDFLETDLRDVPERQQSIRAVFDHSWKLLTVQERDVFQQLSVFRGGFTRQAVQEVTGASLRTLMALVNKSFLYRTSTGRYEIHELLRQYAAEKLAQSPDAGEAVHDRHSAYYSAFLQQRETDLKGTRQQAAATEIEVELKNARVAWNWAVAQEQIERLAETVECLGIFYEWRGRYQEGEAAFRLAAERLAMTESGSRQRFLVRVLAWQGLFNQILGRTEHAAQLLQQSLSLVDSPALTDQDMRAEKAFVLRVMGGVESSPEKARRLLEQSSVLYRALGDDRWRTAVALASLAWKAWGLGNYDQAKQLCQESLTIRQTLGDQRGIASSLRQLGYIVTEQGQLEEAERLVRESLTLFRELGDRRAVAESLRDLSMGLIGAGKFAESRPLAEESLQICKNLGDRWGVAMAHNVLGWGELGLGRYQQARTLLETAQTIFREVGEPLGVGASLFDRGNVALAEKAYAEARQLFEESIAIFREIGKQSLLGQSLASLAYVERGLGNVSKAQKYLFEAVWIATEVGAYWPLWDALPVAALLLADRGEQERAVELYALASRNPYVGNSRWFEDIAGRHIKAVATTLPPEVVAAAQERGKARDLWATGKELIAEIEGWS